MAVRSFTYVIAYRPRLQFLKARHAMFTRNLFTGLRIGLLGGSFNPAHEGHHELSLLALKLMRLDYIWWLVSPGNPQKNPTSYAPYEDRLATAQAIANHPRILISNFEQTHGLTYSANTITTLRQYFSQTKFIWMIGADNLENLHTWKNWRTIANTLPLAIFNRPGHQISALASPAAKTLSAARQPIRAAQELADMQAPAWIYFNQIENKTSATKIRAATPHWHKP